MDKRKFGRGNPAPYGEMNMITGEIIRDVDVCALTGKAIVPGDVFVRVPDTDLFYRVSVQAFQRHDGKVLEAIAALVPEPEPAPKAAPAGKPEEK